MSEPVDRAELLERVDHDMEFLEEAIGMFREDYPNLIDQIKAGVTANDSDVVHKAAHTLKGVISNFCAASAEEAAFRLERAAQGGDLSTGEDGWRTLQEEIDRMLLALNQILQENS
ncbi:MAG: Hpt domain-containing protein [Gemmataceae bacterium]